MSKRRSISSQELWEECKEKRRIQNYLLIHITERSGVNGTTLKNCCFQQFNSAGSRWSGCTFIDCDFETSHFYNTRFQDCQFNGCSFVNSGLPRAKFDKDCQFDKCKIRECDLSDAHLTVLDPRNICLEKNKLTDTRIFGHPYFSDFFPTYVCDDIREGKQSIVYLSRKTSDEQRVAIKVFDPKFHGTSPSAHRLYNVRERDIYRKIESDYVPRLLSYNLDNTPPYIVLERCDGQPLSDWIDYGERFGGPNRKRLFVEAFTGLESLHNIQLGKSLLLRDIKPMNVMVHLPESGGLAWKFIDLGLSKLIQGLTEYASATVGTPLTMAPEVMIGRKDSIQSEIFSLGVTLAWAICGRHPYGNNLDVKDRLKYIRNGPNLQNVEAPYNHILKKCLQFEPDQRFATPREVLETLSI